MLQFISPTVGPKLDDEAVEIERFRARHRRLLRHQAQQFTPSSKVEDLDVDDGRKRKISANWRLKQQQTQVSIQQGDGHWPASAGTEMLMGFNAFDFSASPEAFYGEQEQSVSLCHAHSEQHKQQRMAEVAKQVTSMGFHCASMWEQSLPGLRQPGGPIRQLPAFGQSVPSRSLWVPPMQYTAQGDQCWPPHHQSQHYA
ncbi:hypothetical protein KRP22_005346 [Phytophthora ramorum]|uniref:Uncharacterized protein n=1 Tax=Phytophthora ramorum TaxID=164328 RepID=H3GK08_PHYRM|nr:hypothetical protein KRP22_3523 [Phytophthora ramorum]